MGRYAHCETEGNDLSIVLLASGGLDSAVMAALAKQQGLTIHPLFIDYGQLSKKLELSACKKALSALGLPSPNIADVNGFGKLTPSGLTDVSRDVFLDAFLPGRNMLFLLLGANFAYEKDAAAVAIGLLKEEASLFPDQTRKFLNMAEELLSFSIGREIKIVAPLIDLNKSDVVQIAKEFGIDNTYSCHAGGSEPCGICVACREFEGLED